MAQESFEYINKFKVSPVKIVKEMEKVYTELSFQYNISTDDKLIKSESTYNLNNTNSNLNGLIKDNTSEQELNDETALSIKDIRYKEIKSKINELSNDKKLNGNVILRSEKLNIILTELLSGSYKSRSSEAITSFLQERFDYKYIFSEINWIGNEDGLVSITKFAFNSLNNVEELLKTGYNFGALHVFKNIEGQLEFSLFLAKSIKKQ